MSQAVPTLVYDGDCGICRYWVTYWQQLTRERVIYRPYQQAAADFPTIPLQAFQAAIQFIEPDGRVYSGAAATFRVLRQAPGRTVPVERSGREAGAGRAAGDRRARHRRPDA